MLSSCRGLLSLFYLTYVLLKTKQKQKTLYVYLKWRLQPGNLWTVCSPELCFVWFTHCGPIDDWVSLLKY